MWGRLNLTWRGLSLSVLAGVLLACAPASDAPCADDGDCASTQLCRDRQCRNACNSSLDCTRREACVDGACLPARATDASTADASTADTSASDTMAPDPDRAHPDQGLPADAAQPDAPGGDAQRPDAAAADQLVDDRAATLDAWRPDLAGTEGGPQDQLAIDAASGDSGGRLDGPVRDTTTLVDATLPADGADPPDAAALHQDAGDGGAGSDGTSEAGAGLDVSVLHCPGSSPLVLCPSTDTTLRACYTFDDDVYLPDTGNSSVPDHSAFGNHGLGYGLNHAPGVHGLAAAFASAQMVTVSDDPSLDFVDQVSVEAWVYPEAWPAAGARMGILDNNAQYAIFLKPGGALACTTNSVSNQLEGGQAPLGIWTHVACVLQAGVLRLYVNGVERASSSGLPEMNPGDTNPMNLGANSPSGDYFVGRLDSLRVWSRALTPGEVCWAAQR